MTRHTSNYHLDLAQLWRCLVSWCTQWKGTSQGCSDHIRERHHVGVTVKTANLGKRFPPWTVTRAAWNTVVKSNVSGISTDVVIFSEHGAHLVHHYRVFGDCVAHASLRGSSMIDLLYFNNRACAEARWVVKRRRDSGNGSGLSPDASRHTPDDDPPARKAARAMTSVTQDESSPVGTSTAVSIVQYSALMALVMCQVSSSRQRPSLPVSLSLSLPRFATRDVTPDTAPSLPVVIRPCPSSSGSRLSTPVFDLAEFDSECSRAAMSSSPVSDVVERYEPLTGRPWMTPDTTRAVFTKERSIRSGPDRANRGAPKSHHFHLCGHTKEAAHRCSIINCPRREKLLAKHGPPSICGVTQSHIDVIPSGSTT